MSLAALAFAAGAALLQVQAALPALGWAWCIAVLVLIGLRYRAVLIVAACVAGYFWAAACAHSRMSDWLQPELEGGRPPGVAEDSNLPPNAGRSGRFEFHVEWAEGGPRFAGKILLRA